MRLLSHFLLLIFIVGVVLVFHEPLRNEGTLYSHFVMGIYVLFGLGGFGLIFKKYVYYQYADNIRVTFLNRRSGLVDNLIFKIVIIALVALLNIALFNWGLDNQHTLFLLLATSVGILGVLLNVRPALLLTEKGFYYDDYLPIEWKWKTVEAIEFSEEKILLKGSRNDFEIDLALLQKEDNLWSRALQSEVQQFGGGAADFQKWLHSYAVSYQIPCNL